MFNHAAAALQRISRAGGAGRTGHGARFAVVIYMILQVDAFIVIALAGLTKVYKIYRISLHGGFYAIQKQACISDYYIVLVLK